MNRYMIISRLRWPSLLLLTGIIALLHQAGVMRWGHAWPLYLILLGVLALAERAALASDPSAANYPYPGGYNPGGYGSQAGPYQGPYTGAAPAAGSPSPEPAPPASTGIVPAHSDLEVRSNETRADFRNSGEEEER
jgi:hypothetical protein